MPTDNMKDVTGPQMSGPCYPTIPSLLGVLPSHLFPYVQSESCDLTAMDGGGGVEEGWCHDGEEPPF